MRGDVEKRLKMIEEDYHVRILLAVESGSRAWGFASKDSDFDVRFIYVRRSDDYLKLEKQRDVIELPLDPVWDINGWDLNKTLRLMAASNPTLFEWLNSPIVYCTSKAAEDLKTLGDSYFNVKRAAYHYLNIAKRTYKLMNDDQVKMKKYFYVLRGILACKWCLEKKTIPPVLFSLLAEDMLSEDLKLVCADLLRVKKYSNESEWINRIPCLDAYIQDQLAALKLQTEQYADMDKRSWEALNNYFLEHVLEEKMSC